MYKKLPTIIISRNKKYTYAHLLGFSIIHISLKSNIGGRLTYILLGNHNIEKFESSFAQPDQHSALWQYLIA